MTEFQLKIAWALVRCSLPIGGRVDVSFIRNLSALAKREPERDLTLRQALYLYRLAHRYRRQLPHRLVSAAMAARIMRDPADARRPPVERRPGKRALAPARAAVVASSQLALPLARSL